MPVYSAHLGFQFTEWPLPERFAAAARAGFARVEHPDPYQLGVETFANAARAANLGVSQIAAPSGSAGEKGLACLPGREADFRASVEAGLDAADRIGAAYLHIMSGRLPDGESREGLFPLYLERIAHAADRAAERGRVLLIEPIDDGASAGYFMNDPDFALQALAQLRRGNVKLLFDAFHAHNRGYDVVAQWPRYAADAAHIHVADAPGRHEPGTGGIDYPGFFAALAETGYEGTVGCEYQPAAGTVEGLGWRERFA